LTITVTSKNGVPIRLPDERWAHIAEEHGELDGMQSEVLAAVEVPERILAGKAGELLAVRAVAEARWMVVVYREIEDDGEDGYIITAFVTSKKRSLDKREQLWPSQTIENT
jgi:hypothetical protein